MTTTLTNISVNDYVDTDNGFVQLKHAKILTTDDINHIVVLSDAGTTHVIKSSDITKVYIKDD